MKKTTRSMTVAVGLALAMIVSACSSNMAPQPRDPREPRGPARNPNVSVSDPNRETVFGDGGISLNRVASGDLFRNDQEGGSLPVNKFLWQASLDTLSFMPLSSTDPFTGVIATDWSSTPSAPGERFKVTVYIVNPELSASALKVAVFREIRAEDGLWRPAAVAAETPRKIEDAILTRARQIRIAERDGGGTTG